jgi:hypothetical protein
MYIIIYFVDDVKLLYIYSSKEEEEGVHEMKHIS